MTQSVDFSTLPSAQPFVDAAKERHVLAQRLVSREAALPDWLDARRPTLDLRFDARHGALWCAMRHETSVSWTLPLLRDLNGLVAQIRGRAQRGDSAIKFFVGGSLRPGVFNLGGDLAAFVALVRARDAEGLRGYAYACCDAIYNNYNGFDCSVVTIALLEGDALGGGLEAALSCQVIVAERGVALGFPESLFQTFPGMGAYSLLARRLGPAQAERLMLNGRTCRAEQFHELGLIDILVDKGEGPAAVRRYIEEQSKRHKLLAAMGRVRRRMAPLTLEELRDITHIWVDTVMDLSPLSLRRMEALAQTQNRFFTRSPASA